MLRSGSSSGVRLRAANALVALILLAAAGCGQTAHAPRAHGIVTPRPTSIPSMSAVSRTLQSLPPYTASGPGVWAEIVNRTGTGPMTLTTRRGLHRFDVEFACDGPGAARLVAANGKIVLNVRPSGTRCAPGNAYGTKFQTTRSAQRLRIVVSPSMHWAVQIWAQ